MIPAQPFGPSDFAASYAANAIPSMPINAITLAAETILTDYKDTSSSSTTTSSNSNDNLYLGIGIIIIATIAIGGIYFYHQKNQKEITAAIKKSKESLLTTKKDLNENNIT